MAPRARSSLADQLDAERARLFVGREGPLASLLELLRPSRHQVAYVEGPAGIGKTQLLYAFDRAVRLQGGAVHWLDGGALSRFPSLVHVVEEVRSMAPRPAALVVDNFEQLGRLEQSLREVVVPGLPDDVPVLMAGRRRLSDGWTVDPGWRQSLLHLRLGVLSDDECAAYLRRRGVEGAEVALMIRDSAGHPLTLALLADARQMTGRSVRLEGVADALSRLVSSFVADAPSDAHVDVLYASAILLHVRPELLRDILPHSNTHELYRWLASCSFVEHVGAGLALHGAVRGALLQYLRSRPELLRTLLGAALRRYVAARSDELWVNETLHLWAIASRAGAGLTGPPALRPAGPADWDEIVATAERHESPATVASMHAWRDFGEWLVFEDKGASGFLHLVDVRFLGPTAPLGDRGLRALLDALRGHAALRGSRPCWCTRFWMTRSGYQSLEDAAVWQIHSYVSTLVMNSWPALAAVCVAHGQHGWDRIVQSPGGPKFLEGADFEVNGVAYSWVYSEMVEDTPDDFFRQRLRGLLEALDLPGPSATVAPERIELERRDVKRALKLVRRPWLLGDSRLSALPEVKAMLDSEANLSPGEAVAAVLRTSAERSLGGAGDSMPLQVLTRAYFDPAPKHTVAAAELGMSYRSFRRHLEQAVDMLAEYLRSRAPPAPPGQ